MKNGLPSILFFETTRIIKIFVKSPFLVLLVGILLLCGCAGDRRHVMVVSIPDQKMVVYEDGLPLVEYPVSTSKFGVGDAQNSNQTPLGNLRIKRKIGAGAPEGTVFKSRKPTGEILAVDAPGRDPIVTRILWLEGREPQNKNAFQRYIYIHGTPEERTLGTPASYGCIRMRSHDVAQLYDTVGIGARVIISPHSLH